MRDSRNNEHQVRNLDEEHVQGGKLGPRIRFELLDLSVAHVLGILPIVACYLPPKVEEVGVSQGVPIAFVPPEHLFRKV
jgi:hypothetical protein